MLSLRFTIGLLGGAAFYMFLLNMTFHTTLQKLLHSPLERYARSKDYSQQFFSSSRAFLRTRALMSTANPTPAPSTPSPTSSPSTPSPTVAPSTSHPTTSAPSTAYDYVRVEGEHEVSAKIESQRHVRHGHDVVKKNFTRFNQNVTMCVRDDGGFARPYHDSFTGKRDTSCVSGGATGTTLLYARGGLGNQLHCMAALQRIDPEWKALDHTPRPYLNKDFYERRQIPFDASLRNKSGKGTLAIGGEELHLFPFGTKSLESSPGNCWLVAALQGDACGPEEEKLVESHETLRAKTAEAFASIPINPELKRTAKEFVAGIMRGRKTLIAVHTRTGSLLVDGLSKWNETALDAYTRSNDTVFEWNYRGPPPPNFDTERLLDVLREEIRDVFNKTGAMPVILIASDTPLVGLVLSYRLRGARRPPEIDEEGRFRRSVYFEQNVVDDEMRVDEVRVVLTSRMWKSHREDLANDMVELLAMSHADVIVKDNFLRESTFSEAAWWLGGSIAKRIFTPNNERILLPECLRPSTDYNRPVPTDLTPSSSTKL